MAKMTRTRCVCVCVCVCVCMHAHDTECTLHQQLCNSTSQWVCKFHNSLQHNRNYHIFTHSTWDGCIIVEATVNHKHENNRKHVYVWLCKHPCVWQCRIGVNKKCTLHFHATTILQCECAFLRLQVTDKGQRPAAYMVCIKKWRQHSEHFSEMQIRRLLPKTTGFVHA